jgi:hypothetical protein
MIFNTVNGQIWAALECPMCIPPLKTQVSPYVLRSTPDLLSLGKRCVVDGYTFLWKGHSTRPIWTLPDGSIITLRSEGYIPIMDSNMRPVPATPGTASSAAVGSRTPRSLMVAVGLRTPRSLMRRARMLRIQNEQMP